MWQIRLYSLGGHGWYYNERHHGKGPMDGIGGTVKNLVFRHVTSGKVIRNTPEEFAHYADKVCEGVNPLYLPKEEILEEPGDTETAPGIEKHYKSIKSSV